MARSLYGGYEEERFEYKVDDNLLCPICGIVLKDPVQCQNEHHFCRSCIEMHLHENSETCPVCKRHLTRETLGKPPRVLTNMLGGLKIRCNHANRGCRELVQLEVLHHHVKSCGYSPTHCTNPGCSEVINRHDKERHENQICRFGLLVCEDCKEQVLRKSSRVHPCFMRKEMDEFTRKMDKDMKEVKDEVKQIKSNQEEFRRILMAQVARQNDVVNDLCRRMESTAKKETERWDFFTGIKKIFVLGGRNDKYGMLNSVESYGCPDNTWRKEPSMSKIRSSPAAFVHEGQIYVSGGWIGTKFTDTVERLNVDGDHKEWVETCIKMPVKCSGHKMVCHENNAILTGGRVGDNVSDGIYGIKLEHPHTSKLLTQMPEPRCYHGCNIIDNQVVVVGGRISVSVEDSKNTVYLYDVNTKKCKTLPPLPFCVSQMATVSYKSNVILIGGVNEKSETLNTVVVYDVKTGEIKMLPCLNHRRAGCEAVIIGNIIVVTGGLVCETKSPLKSVECLDLSTNVWQELAPMASPRKYLTAVMC